MESELEARGRWLKSLANRLRERLAESETDSVQALSAYDNHPADLATDTFSRELDTGLSMGLERKREQIKRAEEKLEEGTYGYCDRCGKPIGTARMDAMPDSLYCLKCQEGVDQRDQGPLSESEGASHPYGDRGDIRRDRVQANGEDFWQSLAQWGNSDSPQDVPPAVDYHATSVGFEEPVGYVEEVESIVDENGEVLFDALRQKPIRQADSTDAESDEYPV